MGILYSHVVFQPPAPSSYNDDAGIMTFRRARYDTYDSDDDIPPPTDVSNAGSVEANQHVQHPLVYLKTSKGNTIPAAYFHQPDSYYTILFSHGNGEDLGVTASYALELSNSLKTSVLCYDYSGYGLSTGKPNESNCYADIRAAYTYLVSEKRVAPTRILLFGRSLGSGPTVDLAMALGSQLGGVVLIAALTSCVRVVFTNAPHTMKFDMFANVDKIDKIMVPVFCVHGMLDDVVPFSHGLELVKRARFPLEPLWIRGAGHNNLESSRFQYEVFLRYMKVLHEFRRWKPPSDMDELMGNTTRRRESFGALVKAAGCFGPKTADDEDGGAFRSTSKRRVQRLGSSSQLLVPPLRNKHETDLRALWNGGDESLGKRASQERRSDRKARPLQGRKPSVSSPTILS